MPLGINSGSKFWFFVASRSRFLTLVVNFRSLVVEFGPLRVNFKTLRDDLELWDLVLGSRYRFCDSRRRF